MIITEVRGWRLQNHVGQRKPLPVQQSPLVPSNPCLLSLPYHQLKPRQPLYSLSTDQAPHSSGPLHLSFLLSGALLLKKPLTCLSLLTIPILCSSSPEASLTTMLRSALSLLCLSFAWTSSSQHYLSSLTYCLQVLVQGRRGRGSCLFCSEPHFLKLH